MNKIEKRSKLFSLVISGAVGVIGLIVGGGALHAQTTSINTATVINSVNSTDNYIFSDLAASGNSSFDASVPAGITMNSVQLGGNHGLILGSRTLTITSGNLAFASTGSSTIWSTVSGGNITTTASNLNISNSKAGGAGLHSVLSGTNSVTFSSTANSLFVYGANTYSGGTFVNSGNILFTSSTGFGLGAVTLNGGTTSLMAANTQISSLVMNGGTLTVANWVPAGFNQTSIGTLALSSNSTLLFGNASAESYAFANSSALSWNGDLTLNGFTVGTDSIRFGTDGNSLTSAQLARIKLSGNPTFQFGLDSSGYLVNAIPEPSTYAMVLLSILAIGFAYRRQLA